MKAGTDYSYDKISLTIISSLKNILLHLEVQISNTDVSVTWQELRHVILPQSQHI